MKNIKIICFIITFIITSYAYVDVLANTQSNNSTSILWEVKSKSDTSKVAYLLGSIHIAIPELYPLNPVIMDAWNKCNVLAVELNILDIKTSDMFGTLSLVGKLISFEEKLYDKLPADLYLKVKNALIKNGISEEMIDVFTPLAVVIMLELGDASNLVFNKDSTSVDGIDMYFLKWAKMENKPIYEVESISTQIAALETLNENIIPYLQSKIDGLDDDSNTDINKLFNAWKNGDVKTIENMINIPPTSDKKLNEKIMNALLYDRNINMANKIEKYLTQKETYFIVLGAGHYVGMKSIIDILQKTGNYYIKRL
jgi:uncharacterized protein YbaP (TraB family)